MNTPTRLGVYGVGLVVAFAAALGVGRLVGPQESPAPPMAGGHGETEAHAEDQQPPGGLQVGEAGYRLVPLTATLTAGAPVDFRFQVLGPDGAAVTRFTPTHTKDVHVIVVRRDLSGFQHVHPTMAADGTWSVPLTVTDAGQYRVFADFQPAGRDDNLTLGVDVPAGGAFEPRPLPAPARATTTDGYQVEVSGDLAPGTSSRLTLRVSRNGAPVTDLSPYLGAYGHLVALRAGDLAYLHVHPDEGPAGPEIAFHAEVPSAGTYRLYLDFQHGGTVRTAEFTMEAHP